MTDPDLLFLGTTLRPGDVFVDCGANVGLFTLVAAAAVGPRGRVIAFEPARVTRERLLRNVRANAFDWVTVRPEAVADEERAATLYSFEADRSGLSALSRVAADATEEPVAVTTLDTALDTGPLVPTFIKIDVEGAEAMVLSGARDTLRSARPDLMLEVSPDNLRRLGSGVGEIHSLLDSLGYDFYHAAFTSAGQPSLRKIADLGAERDVNVYASADTGRLDALGVAIT